MRRLVHDICKLNFPIPKDAVCQMDDENQWAITIDIERSKVFIYEIICHHFDHYPIELSSLRWKESFNQYLKN